VFVPLERIRTHRTLHGAIAGPFEVWLALRGLRTLRSKREQLPPRKHGNIPL
jgi:cystathionine beta-lyase/cystathionine gamma-synthase